MTVFIGDVHGKWDRYKKIIADHPKTIQVGDFGIGFKKYVTGDPDTDEFYSNPPYDKMVKGGHRFINGNHDNPNVCKTHTQWIPHGHVEGEVMFLGGALSIDKEWRMPNYTWWENEELSIGELTDLQVKYMDIKPKVMVTHDTVEYAAQLMFHRPEKFNYPSRTRQALTVMWENHKPDIWIYGHWHKSFDEVICGTRFVCLNELEYKDINVGLD